MSLEQFCFLVLILVAVHGTPVDETDDEWRIWKLMFGKSYGSLIEESRHRETWLEKLNFVQRSNKVDIHFRVGLNEFSDQKTKPRRLTRVNDVGYPELNVPGIKSHLTKGAPLSWDWREHGAVSPVKSQLQTENPEAVVAAECVESYRVITEGRSLLSCSNVEVQQCCLDRGLYNPHVFDCLHVTGLCLNSTYNPNTGTCSNGTCTSVASVKGGRAVPRDEKLMQTSLLSNPLMVLIDASQNSFLNYQGGVYDDSNCSKALLNHVVQIVGYGTDNGTDYWICKNSWGPSWGMNGYINIVRNKNMCGIAEFVTYPI
ncbi:hypothetical protein ScPMuIL_015181 [Solemya velum]